MKSILVIPSIRESSLLEFFDTWHASGCADWDEAIVIEDNPQKTFVRLPKDVKHAAWNDIGLTLGNDAWIISRRDSAIRCFGFLMAYRDGADMILTLDDDVRPRGLPICAAHIQAMNSHPRWVPSIPGMRTRGLPYFNLGKLDVVMNMGLWSNVPDLDAVQTLAGHANATCFEPPKGSRIIPAGQYTCVCGMNLAFIRKAIPLCYFPLMGHKQKYARFDDIWCGVVAQKILGHLGWRLSVGDPSIEHIRASDHMKNLIKEAPGIAANEWIWKVVDAVRLTASNPIDCMIQMGNHLAGQDDQYLQEWGKAIGIWAGLFA